MKIRDWSDDRTTGRLVTYAGTRACVYTLPYSDVMWTLYGSVFCSLPRNILVRSRSTQPPISGYRGSLPPVGSCDHACQPSDGVRHVPLCLCGLVLN